MYAPSTDKAATDANEAAGEDDLLHLADDRMYDHKRTMKLAGRAAALHAQ